MNRCLTTPELSQFLEGELDAAFMAEVESHLETCGVCQSALERMLDSEWHSSIAPATEGLGKAASMTASGIPELEAVGRFKSRLRSLADEARPIEAEVLDPTIPPPAPFGRKRQ